MLLVPREMEGREPLCACCGGLSFVSPRVSNGFFVGSATGVGMLSVKYCSDEMNKSGRGIGSSLIGGNEVPGMNSVASGLKEKVRGDDMGDRRNGVVVAVGGASVDARECILDNIRELPRPRSFGSVRFIIPVLLACEPSNGKYDTRPLNLRTSALLLIRFQQPSISAYCSLHARYNHSFDMSSRGALTDASSSNRS